MVILHIASIRNTATNGVNVVVPQHIRAQSEFVQVGFVNITGEEIPDIEKQFSFKENLRFSDLPEPFCRPDFIVFHEVYKAKYLKLYRQAKKERIPYIIIPHGCLTDGAQKKKRLKKVLGNLLLFRPFINGAVAMQFLSEVERATSRFGQNAFLGTNGVIMPVRRKTSFEKNGIRMVYIGRLDIYHKGLDFAVVAIRTVAANLRASGSELDIYGPDYGGWLGELNALIAQNQVEDLVTTKGPVYGKEKEDVLINTDIFVQTSRFEGMPLGILEALSYGIPCLVTKGTNLGEIIEKYDAGWVAEPDAGSVAEVILLALSERERWEEKSQNAIKLVEENFQWSKVAEDTIKEYEKLFG